MSTTHGVAPYPLYWPLLYLRSDSAARRDAQFRVDFASARYDLLRELELLRARDVLISSNIPIRRDGLPAVPDREPDDPGIAVYFNRKGKPFVIACDQFRRVRWNVRAIGSTLEALRSIERHGTTTMLEQAFSGFAALPAATSAERPWREVLGCGVLPGFTTNGATVVRERYRELARTLHPDRGGSDAAMTELNRAYEQAMKELGEAT
jgi:hypothetical protein